MIDDLPFVDGEDPETHHSKRARAAILPDATIRYFRS